VQHFNEFCSPVIIGFEKGFGVGGEGTDHKWGPEEALRAEQGIERDECRGMQAVLLVVVRC